MSKCSNNFYLRPNELLMLFLSIIFVNVRKVTCVLAESGTRTLGSIINKYRYVEGLSYKSYKINFNMYM